MLSDQCGTKDDFNESCEKIKIKLDSLFTFPDLSRNMRNSESINSAGQGVQRIEGSPYTITNLIRKLPPPTLSSYQEKPFLIPIEEKDFESSFQNILNKEVFNPKKKTLILHSKSFNERDIKSLILKNFPSIKPENILKHDVYPNDATKDDLQMFLKQPEIKIGIFQSRFVTGMEGSNVIYFYDNEDYFTSTRCSMTRAVSHLCIIHQFKDNRYTPITLKKTKLNNKYIKCVKKFDKDRNYRENVFQCLTCDTTQICAACSIGCHHEHKVKCDSSSPSIVKKGFLINTGECNCSKSNCLIREN